MTLEGGITFLPSIRESQKTVNVEVGAEVPIAFSLDGEFNTAIGILPDFKEKFNKALSESDYGALTDLKDADSSQYNAALLLFADKIASQIGKRVMGENVNAINRGKVREEISNYFRVVYSKLPGAREYYLKIMQTNLRSVLPTVTDFYDKIGGNFTTTEITPHGAAVIDARLFEELSDDQFNIIGEEIVNNIEVINRMGYWKGVLVSILAEDHKLWTSASSMRQGAGNRLANPEAITPEAYRQQILNKARIVAFVNQTSPVGTQG